MDILKKIKTLLQIKDDSKDDLLNTIIDLTSSALFFKIGQDNGDVPQQLQYIVVEVSIRRYNKLKNEGFASYTQEGESITFNSNDFDDFDDDIASYKALHNMAKTLGYATLVNPYEGDY